MQKLRVEQFESRLCPDAAYWAIATSDLAQDWTTTTLIATNDTWTGVPSIIGYRGDGLTATTGVNPQTVVGASSVVNVIANQSAPNTLATGGLAEFQITNPTIALNGSVTASAPYLQLHVDTTGVTSPILVSYDLRDLDASVDNAVMQVALQYRIGTTGDFVDVPAGYVADATTGPSQATKVTSIAAILPAAVQNQSQVQIRIITTNAAGNNEWVGVDNIRVSPVGEYGDAPLSYGLPVHAKTATPLKLGSTSDYEVPPSGTLTGTEDGADDNGITFTATVAGAPTFVPGQTMSVIVNSSAAAKLDAWFDFNADGDFADAGEQIATAAALSLGNTLISFAVPAGATPGETYVRFRNSTLGGLTATGTAGDGEVEDYVVRVGSLTGGTVVLHIAEGWNGYVGTQDTQLLQPLSGPDGGPFGDLTVVNLDPSANSTSGNRVQGNFKFGNLFGSGALQIPSGSAIASASMYLAQQSGNGDGANASAYRMLVDWDESTLTWTNAASLAGGNGTVGIQPDNVDANLTSSFLIPSGVRFTFSDVNVNVTNDLTYWIENPTKNFGWNFQINSGTTRSIDISTSEEANLMWRPRLIVTYAPALPAPIVTSVAAFIGPTSGGNTVVISGLNFTDVTAVKFGATSVAAANYTVVSTSQITAIVPAGASTVDVTVTAAGGTSSAAEASDNYTYAAPAVSSIAVNGGTSVARDTNGRLAAVANQSSVVSQILVTFNQKVKLDDGAFSITSRASNVTTNGLAASAADVAVVATGDSSTGDAENGYVKYLLTFAAGAGVNSHDHTADGGTAFTTLKDGFYRLDMVGTKVHAQGDVAANYQEMFWSLFGAVNPGDVITPAPHGSGANTLRVDGLALSDVYSTFGSSSDDGVSIPYSVAFDWDLDGDVDGIDLSKLYLNFGTIWNV